MKIITNTKYDGVLCYVQVKDYLYLARISKNEALMNIYISLINRGHGDDYFIRVTNLHYIEAFKRCDDIVNFVDYKRDDIEYLSSVLVTMNVVYPQSEYDKEAIRHKSDGIRDIMSLKKGELDYSVPIIPSGELEIDNDDVVFTSSVIPDWYIFRKKNGNEESIDEEFLDLCIDNVFKNDYAFISTEERKYRLVDNGSTIYLNVLNRMEKKKSKIGNILQRILKKG